MASEQQPDWRRELEFVTYYDQELDAWITQAVLRDGPQGRRVVLSADHPFPSSALVEVRRRAELLTWHREGTGKAARWVPDAEGES